MTSPFRHLLPLLAVVILGGCASPLAGTWLSVSRAGHRLPQSERFTTHFTSGGEVTVTEAHAAPHPAMRYSVDGNIVTFSSGNGAEKYRFGLEDDKLRLQPLNDAGTRPAGKVVVFRKIGE